LISFDAYDAAFSPAAMLSLPAIIFIIETLRHYYAITPLFRHY
jgi:hypothetical protein